MKFPFLATFILFIILFNIRIRRVSRKEEQREEKFWERELRSNSVRKKSLDSLEYVHIPYDLLPFGTAGEDENLQKIEDELTAMKDEKIVNLTGITNTDLKLEYGTANITVLTQYDQNYTNLVIALQKWGDALYALGRFEDAAKVLEFAVKTRTDITATYRLLIDMYKTKLELNEEEIQRKLDGLLPIAKNLNSLSRDVILKLLDYSEKAAIENE
jgi:tetratricopeptide (TPR) repeat protein